MERSRITFSLTSFRACPNLLESYLRKAIREIRREDGSSAIRLDRIDSLSLAERDQWRCVRRSLERNGFTISILEQNKTQIIQSLQLALATDAIEKQHDGPERQGFTTIGIREKPKRKGLFAARPRIHNVFRQIRQAGTAF